MLGGGLGGGAAGAPSGLGGQAPSAKPPAGAVLVHARPAERGLWFTCSRRQNRAPPSRGRPRRAAVASKGAGHGQGGHWAHPSCYAGNCNSVGQLPLAKRMLTSMCSHWHYATLKSMPTTHCNVLSRRATCFPFGVPYCSRDEKSWLSNNEKQPTSCTTLYK